MRRVHRPQVHPALWPRPPQLDHHVLDRDVSKMLAQRSRE
jgi:hypothetical protein